MTDQMRDVYGDKVEVTIYLTPDQSAQDPDCRESPCVDINKQLQANTDVETIEYESQAAATSRPAAIVIARCRSCLSNFASRACSSSSGCRI